MKCGSCGAEIPPDATVCEYCRTRVDPPERLESDEPQPDRPPARAEIFERIKASQAYARRRSQRRLSQLASRGLVEHLFPIGFVSLWLVAALVITGTFFSIGRAGPFPSSPPSWIALVPLGMAAFGGVVLVLMLRELSKALRAPIVGHAAIVVGKRTAVSGGGQNSSASTSYYATFEFEDGARDEFRLRERLFGQLSERDAGVLFTRHTMALDFDRIVE